MNKKIVAGILAMVLVFASASAVFAESRADQQGSADYRSGYTTTRDGTTVSNQELERQRQQREAEQAAAAAKAEAERKERERQAAAEAQSQQQQNSSSSSDSSSSSYSGSSSNSSSGSSWLGSTEQQRKQNAENLVKLFGALLNAFK